MSAEAVERLYQRERSGGIIQDPAARQSLMLAVGEVTNELSTRVALLQGISKQEKEEAAYSLAWRIREYGVQLSYMGTRQWTTDDAFSPDELRAIDRAGLVVGVEIKPEYNLKQWQYGFGSPKAWDKAVFETASRILECRWCEHFEGIVSPDLEARFYSRMLEISRRQQVPSLPYLPRE